MDFAIHTHDANRFVGQPHRNERSALSSHGSEIGLHIQLALPRSNVWKERADHTAIYAKRRQPRPHRIHHRVASFPNPQFFNYDFRSSSDLYKNPGNQRKRGRCIRRCFESVPSGEHRRGGH